MFGAMDEREDGRATAVESPKAVSSSGPIEDGQEHRPHIKYRVTLPRRGTFFDGYAGKWTWESWAKRVEHEWLMIARGMEAVIWGTVGGLLGLACSAVPGALVDNYSYVLWQPVGAAAGAAAGVILAWCRWRQVFRSHRSLSR